MRAFYLLILILHPALAFAVDLRGVSIGDSCQHAIEIETALGTKPKYDVERMLQNKFVLFEDASKVGENKQLLYRCSDSPGVVLGYSITLATSSEPLAWSAYARAKAEMQARLGIPSNDSETLSLPKRIKLWRVYSPTFAADEISEWKNAPGQSVSVTIQKPHKVSEWQVTTLDLPPLGTTVHKP